MVLLCKWCFPVVRQKNTYYRMTQNSKFGHKYTALFILVVKSKLFTYFIFFFIYLKSLLVESVRQHSLQGQFCRYSLSSPLFLSIPICMFLHVHTITPILSTYFYSTVFSQETSILNAAKQPSCFEPSPRSTQTCFLAFPDHVWLLLTSLRTLSLLSNLLQIWFV